MPNFSLHTYDPSNFTGSYSYRTITIAFRKDDRVSYESIPNHNVFWSYPKWCHQHNLKTFGDLENWVNDKGVPEYPFYDFLARIGRWDSDGFHVKEDLRRRHLCVFSLGYPNTNQFILLGQQGSSSRTAYSFDGFDFDYDLEDSVGIRDVRLRWTILETQEPATNHTTPTEYSEYLFSRLNYNFAPPFGNGDGFKFHTESNETTRLFFGMELEISTAISPKEMQLIVTSVEPIQKPFFYMKHDGSIHPSMSHCYEIVTMPCSFSFLKKNLRIFFSKIEKLCEQKGVPVSRVIDVAVRPSNGLHIHISKDAFSSPTIKNRFASIWNQWDSSSLGLLNSMTKRPNPIERSDYYHTHPNLKDRTLSYRLKTGAVVVSNNERRSACRETDRTLEVRVFQGMWDLDHVLNSLQIVKAMFDYSHEMPLSAFGMKFSTHFKNWLESKGGYVRVKKVIRGEK